MAHRINERNAGYWTLNGEPKIRRIRKQKSFTDSDRQLLRAVIERVIDSMQYDPDISDRGHLHPDAKFTDRGRFVLCLNRSQFEQLGEIYQKI